MRGKLNVIRRQVKWNRIIPAHAGQTGSVSPSAAASTDHPRTCGANVRSWSASMTLTGSSPHMRGKHVFRNDIFLPIRIIPAHAGQTHREVCAARPQTDHPRTCRANYPFAELMKHSTGSSPHIRGKLRHVPSDRLRQRIIPAHAGQTCTLCACVPVDPDHPRTCGANLASLTKIGRRAGSSPHMRGKLGERLLGGDGFRIIPAHAGQTPPV